MSTQEILRAWRDHDYWLSLSEAERALVPENPAGLVELMDVELDFVTGATHGEFTCAGSCTCEASCWGTACMGSQGLTTQVNCCGC